MKIQQIWNYENMEIKSWTFPIWLQMELLDDVGIMLYSVIQCHEYMSDLVPSWKMESNDHDTVIVI